MRKLRHDLRMIACVDRQWGIGRSDGSLLFDLPGDRALFRDLTEGSVVIMGRKTWESLPQKNRPLPGRFNVILSTTLTPQDVRTDDLGYEITIRSPDQEEEALRGYLDCLPGPMVDSVDWIDTWCGVTVAHSVTDALMWTELFADRSVYVIGGAQVYKELEPYCGSAVITHAEADGDADVFLDPLPQTMWERRLVYQISRPDETPSWTAYSWGRIADERA